MLLMHRESSRNASVSRLSISPATTKLWPSPSSTLVSARRVESAGIRNPLSVTRWRNRWCETSWRRCHLDGLVRGDQRSEQQADAELAELHGDRAGSSRRPAGWAPGIRRRPGSWLPCRWWSPGSARRESAGSLSVSSALMNAPMFKSGRNAKNVEGIGHGHRGRGAACRLPVWASRCPRSNCSGGDAVRWCCSGAGREEFTPYCCALERSSSANLTRSRICFSIGPGGDLQVVHHRLGEGRPTAPPRGPRHPCSRPCRSSASESRELWMSMFSLGKVS